MIKHLTDPMFRGVYHSSRKHHDDFQDMLSRSKEHGVARIIVTGGSLSDSQEALKLAQNHDNLYSTVGCHPTRCTEFDQHPGGPGQYLDELKNLALSDRSKVIALGELGLDYDRLHFCDAKTQKLHFEEQLKLSPTLGLPLFLHNRNSIDDFVQILSRNRDICDKYGGVVHSFDGSSEDVETILNLGLHIGVNGCSLKTEGNLEVARKIPIERILIETDCPWCEIKRTHAGYKHVKSGLEKSKNASDPKLCVKNRNEPMNLIQVLEVLAAVRNEDPEHLAQQIYDNTMRLFFDKVKDFWPQIRMCR